MPRSLALLAIGLLLGGGLGFFLAAANNVALDGHHHLKAAARGLGHAHDGATIALPHGPDAPTLEFSVTRDATSGWNLSIETTNFSFAPERANAAHRPGEGHAHVYVDGKKIARVYGPWFHLDELPAGSVEIAVALSANDHSELTLAGNPLRAVRTITVE